MTTILVNGYFERTQELSMTDQFFDEPRQHSKIKAQIVAKYFPAWAKIMAARLRTGGFLVYLDLMAGPGYYDDGSPSTPILAAEQVLANARLRGVVRLVLNDADPVHAAQLRAAMQGLPDIPSLKQGFHIYQKEVDDGFTEELARVRLAPTFAFVDPWGYKGLTRALIGSLVKDWGCECLFFFNFEAVRRALQNPLVDPAMEALFSPARAAELRTRMPSLAPAQQEAEALSQLHGALIEVGAGFVLPFRFRLTAPHHRSYHLVFVTKHVLGYTIMKDVMRELSTRPSLIDGSFEYVPADENYPGLLALLTPPEELAPMLRRDFAGCELQVREVVEQHQVGRAFVLRDYKGALKQLVTEGHITVRDPLAKKRRAGALADDLVVCFPPAGG
jgi:three-Cys-motif partner protein